MQKTKAACYARSAKTQLLLTSQIKTIVETTVTAERVILSRSKEAERRDKQPVKRDRTNETILNVNKISVVINGDS